MKTNITPALLLLLPLVTACQGDGVQDEVQIPDTPKRVFTVRGSLPGEPDTRSQITYGNPEIGREDFLWNEEDYIMVFNISRLEECPDGIQLETTDIEGSVATFQSLDDVGDFRVKAGDMLFVNYWYADRPTISDASYADHDIFSILVASSENKPQLTVRDPDDSSMAYMQGNLKMYDIVTAVQDDIIPDLHFRHLSAIMRITLRNETGAELFPKELEFEYPGTDTFFSSYLYCSVQTDAENGSGLLVYDTPEFYEEVQGSGSQPYSDKATSYINNYTAALDAKKGEPLNVGETYDLYLSCVPRIANKVTGDRLVIRLGHRLSSEAMKWYEMTLDGFDVAIEAGKRYWFNLTAVKDEDGEGKLMFTREWEDRQNAGNPEEPGQDTPEN